MVNLKNKFFIFEKSDQWRLGMTFIVRPKDWVYLDINLGFRFLMITLWRLK